MDDIREFWVRGGGLTWDTPRWRSGLIGGGVLGYDYRLAVEGNNRDYGVTSLGTKSSLHQKELVYVLNYTS